MRNEKTLSNTRLLTPQEVAEFLGVRVNTLNYWRCTGRYELPYTKIGRLVRYRPADVDAFIESRTVTAEERP
jgi:excisionase family DNA binding protein